jgi:farnesyl diphosphate synthase
MTPADAESFSACLAGHRARVEQALERWLPPESDAPGRLHAAMRHAALGGGKRVRAVLVYATAQALGVSEPLPDAPAAAVELIHAYSLVHDDLPAMDDDDLRRGLPTCHRAFDEATALLAGDALQTLAFEILAGAEPDLVPESRRVEMLRVLARASGSGGMAGGQAIDLAAVGRQLDLTELDTMHRLKTGALIRASVRLGCLCAAGVEPAVIARLEEYADCIGLAFQIRDDVLDVEGETGVLGKTAGADSARDKPTYPSIVGLAEAKRRAEALHDQALGCLEGLGPSAAPLRWLSEFVVSRDR